MSLNDHTADAAKDVAQEVSAFFARFSVASVRLPDGWFGRPYDNHHRLTKIENIGGSVVVELDGCQELTVVEPTAVDVEAGVLRVTGFAKAVWDWVEYGGNRRHRREFGSGNVEFFAPAVTVVEPPAVVVPSGGVHLYAEVRALASALSDAGFPAWADRIEDMIAVGSTATEILMGLRWVLGELLAQEKQLPSPLRAGAVDLEREISEILG